MAEPTNWYFGNARADGEDRRGWFVRYFMLPDDIRMSKDVEVKWGTHPAAEQREAWQADEYRTTVLVLVQGRLRINLSVDSYVLEREGDYAMWGDWDRQLVPVAPSPSARHHMPDTLTLAVAMAEMSARFEETYGRRHYTGSATWTIWPDGRWALDGFAFDEEIPQSPLSQVS
jgi:hypothetical protein